MEDCPFCKIISGEIPAKKIYEDDSCVAILDIYPATAGHILLISKKHHRSFVDISDADVQKIGIVAKKLSENLIRLLKPEGVSIFVADGTEAGQRAPHFMMHIICRYKDDGVAFELKKQDLDIEATFMKIKKHIGA